ncbi:MAG: VOC family protein [Nitrospirae bacterium]|nr:VOC family protein [Nitrospirota bacterium]
MLLNHAGVVNKSKEEALRFYRDFLGLAVLKEAVISKELSGRLFSVDRDVTMLAFGKEGVKIEVFICPECRRPQPDFSHIGLLLENFSEVMEKAPSAGVEVITGKTKEKTVYFIRDFSGNPVEIKQL